MLDFVKSCWITYRIAGRKGRRWDKAQKREREVRSSFKFMVFQHSIIRFESEWLPRGAIHLHVAWVSCIDDRLPMIDSTPCEFLKEHQKNCWQSLATNELVFIATARNTHNTSFLPCFLSVSNSNWINVRDVGAPMSFDLNQTYSHISIIDFVVSSRLSSSPWCVHTQFDMFIHQLFPILCSILPSTWSSLANSRKRFQVDAVAVLWVPSLHQQ